MRKGFLFFTLLIFSLLCGCKDARKNQENADGQNPTNEVIVGITQDLDSLDPHVALAAGTDEVLFNIFEGLVKVDENGNVNPAVAEKYVISDDAMKYTFTLRDNVLFHNGDTVKVADAVYSLKRCAGLDDAIDPSVTVESAFSVIKSIYSTDEKTVVVELKEPNTELIYYLTCAIIPADYKDQATAPVGTGPFKFTSYSPLHSFVIEKFDKYYGTPAYLDKVTFRIYANNDAAFLELLAGKIDLMSSLTIDQANQLKEKYNIEASNYNLVQAMFLNNSVKPFDNVKVRQALCLAVDRNEINKMISDGQGNLIGSGMFPGLATFFAKDLVNTYSYNTEKAKQLLSEAGYPDGFSFTLTIPSSYDAHVQTGEIIAEQLKKIGITVKINLVEWSTWLSDVYVGRNFEATIIGLDANLAPNDILKRYNSTASNNFINYKNDAFDKAFSSGINSISTDEKVKYYHECQKLLTEDAASVFIQDPAKLTAVKKGLTGYTPYPVYVLDMAKIHY